MTTHILSAALLDMYTIYSHECKDEKPECMINMYMITIILVVLLPWTFISMIFCVVDKKTVRAFLNFSLFLLLLSLL